MIGDIIPNNIKKEDLINQLNEIDVDIVECYIRTEDKVLCLMGHGISAIPIDKFNLDLRSEEYKKQCEEENNG